MESAPTRRKAGLRAQLMLFLCLTSILTLTAVGLLVGGTLQPQYERYLKRELTEKLELLAAPIDTAAKQGIRISSRQSGRLELYTPFWEELDAACAGKLGRCCVDISDRSVHFVNYSDSLRPCLVHETSTTLFGGGQVIMGNPDTNAAISLRQRTFHDGTLFTIREDGDGRRQMIVGRVAGEGDYCVIVSASLTPVEDAGIVIRSMLLPIALLLLALDLLAGWLFTNWCTRPLRQLSDAAQQMARGNYDVRVSVNRGDDMGGLAQDFNHMASEVKRSAELQRDLLANVSHDLRTPLTLIKGYAETVRDLTGDNAQRRTGQLNIIIDETDRLSGLVNSVMELSKVQSGADKPERVTFDMCQLCEEVAERYEGVCSQNGWRLICDLPDQRLMVNADPGMMERVLHNLLGNAMNHLGADGTFIVRAQQNATGIQVEVEDHGPGIPAAELPHLFDRYYRSRSDSGKQGTGLGLSITKAILVQHGFRYGVSSAVGKGTIFWFVMTPPGARYRINPPKE